MKTTKKKMAQHIISTPQALVLMDLTDVPTLEITIKADGKVIWINTPQGCVLRACRVNRLMIYDERVIQGVITDPVRKK